MTHKGNVVAHAPPRVLVRRFHLVAGLTALIGIRVLIGLWLYQCGLRVPSLEGPARALEGFYFSAQHLLHPTHASPPVQFAMWWLVWKVTDHVVEGVMVWNGVLSILSALVLFAISRRLFNSTTTATVCFCLSLFLPRGVLVSMDSLPEPALNLLFLLSMYFLLCWVSRSNVLCLYAAAIAMAVGTAVREEMWFVYLLFLGHLAYHVVINRASVLTRLGARTLGHLLGAAVIAGAFIAYRQVRVLAIGGSLLSVLDARRNPLREAAGDAYLLQSLLTYPVLIVLCSPLVGAVFIPALFRAWRSATVPVRVFHYFVLGQLALLFLSGGLGAIATGLPQRTVLINVFGMTPLVSHHLLALRRRRPWTVNACLVLAALACVGPLLAFPSIAAFNDMYLASVQLGKGLRIARESGILRPSETVLVEVSNDDLRFDTQVLSIATGAPSSVVTDKIYDHRLHRDLSDQRRRRLVYPVNLRSRWESDSIFDRPQVEEIRGMLAQEQVAVIICKSDKATRGIPSNYELIAAPSGYRVYAQAAQPELARILRSEITTTIRTITRPSGELASAPQVEGWVVDRSIAPKFIDLVLSCPPDNVVERQVMVELHGTPPLKDTRFYVVRPTCAETSELCTHTAVRVNFESISGMKAGIYELFVDLVSVTPSSTPYPNTGVTELHCQSRDGRIGLGRYTIVIKKPQLIREFLLGKRFDYSLLAVTTFLLI